MKISYFRIFSDESKVPTEGHKFGPLAVSRRADHPNLWQIDHIQSGVKILPTLALPFFHPNGLNWMKAQSIAKILSHKADIWDFTTRKEANITEIRAIIYEALDTIER